MRRPMPGDILFYVMRTSRVAVWLKKVSCCLIFTHFPFELKKYQTNRERRGYESATPTQFMAAAKEGSRRVAGAVIIYLTWWNSITSVAAETLASRAWESFGSGVGTRLRGSLNSRNSIGTTGCTTHGPGSESMTPRATCKCQGSAVCPEQVMEKG